MSKKSLSRLVPVALVFAALLVPVAALAAPRAIGIGLQCDGITYNPGNPDHVLVPDPAGALFNEFDPDGDPTNGNEELRALVDLRGSMSGKVVFVDYLGFAAAPGDAKIGGLNPSFPDWHGLVEIWGTDFDDIVCGGVGPSWVYGFGGDDRIFGETMALLNGFADIDVRGRSSARNVFQFADMLAAGGGDDVVYAGFSPNDPQVVQNTDARAIGWGTAIWGGSGEDFLVGWWGNDAIRGGGADDVIYGLTGSDELRGNNGDDEIWGNQPHADTPGGDGLPDDHMPNYGLWGGEGRDLLVAGEGGEGKKMVNPAYPGAVDDPFVPAFIPDLGGALQPYYGMFGNAGDDVLMGAPLTGDTGEPAFATDVANGGPGNDYIEGYSCPDLLQGGTGDDVIYGDSATRYNDGVATEVDMVICDHTGPYVIDTRENGFDVQVITGGKGDDQLFGGDYADQILGQANRDLLAGDAMDDVLGGGAAADEMFGDGGEDWLQGDRGTDLMYQDDGSTNLADGGGLASGQKGADELHGSADGDTLYGDDTAATIGGASVKTGDDKVFGHGGDDDIDGGLGDDELRGGEGVDTIFGDFGADTIYGGGGDDELYAGTFLDAVDAAIDAMFGGFGDDDFFSVCSEDDSASESAFEGVADVTHGVQFAFGEIETVGGCAPPP